MKSSHTPWIVTAVCCLAFLVLFFYKDQNQRQTQQDTGFGDWQRRSASAEVPMVAGNTPDLATGSQVGNRTLPGAPTSMVANRRPSTRMGEVSVRDLPPTPQSGPRQNEMTSQGFGQVPRTEFENTQPTENPSAVTVTPRQDWPANVSAARPVRGPALTHVPPPKVLPVSSSLVMEKIAQGESLARRNAVASAQKQIQEALNLLAQQHDNHRGNATASQALGRAWLAMREAGDFYVSGEPLGTEQLASLVGAHQTKILDRRSVEGLNGFQAAQAYYTVARQNFQEAFGKNPVASRGLYDLGKILSLSQLTPQQLSPAQQSQIILLHYAALDCDDKNYPAAHELGVMLARNGQLAEARDVLQHGLRIQPTLATWQSVAKVHDQLGEYHLAEQARAQAKLLDEAPTTSAPGGGITYLEPAAFAAMPDFSLLGPGNNSASVSTAAPVPAAPPERSSKRFWDRVLSR